MTVKDPPASGVFCKTHHTSTHQHPANENCWYAEESLLFFFCWPHKFNTSFPARHIPETFEEDKRTSIACENSSGGYSKQIDQICKILFKQNRGCNRFPGSKEGNNHMYFIPPIVSSPHPSPTSLREQHSFAASKTQLGVSAVTEIMHWICLSPFCSCFQDWSLVVTHICKFHCELGRRTPISLLLPPCATL